MEHLNLKIFIADHHLLFRRGLNAFLSRESGIYVVGEASSLEECLAKARPGWTDVLVFDAGLTADPNTVRTLPEQSGVPVLFVAEEGQRELLHECGAPYILKTEAPKVILRALRNLVLRTEEESAPARNAADLQSLAKSTQRLGAVPGLTTRENEILKMLAETRTARAVAEELGLSIKTVEAHKLNVMRKLGVHNRAALIRYAADHGLLPESVAPVEQVS